VLELIPLALTAVTLLGYAAGLHRLHRRQVQWPMGRTACLVAGSVCVAAAVLPPVASHDDLFPMHIGQHLLIGMAGPGLLALSAPITLALRALPSRSRRSSLRLLHSRVVRLLTTPATAVVLDVGGLCVLYLTGLYARAENNDLIHATVHLHMFVAGCLLSWAIIGVDPIRRRPSLPIRVATLIVAGAAHDTLSKLMYAHDLPAGGGPLGDRHTGAELMYYGGTAIDLALTTVLMVQWWRVTGRMLSHSARRARTHTAAVRQSSQPRGQSAEASSGFRCSTKQVVATAAATAALIDTSS
jgi:putative membrane protein